MIHKHRKTTELPKGFEVTDPAIIKYIDDMGKALRQTLKNIYDDSIALEKAEVTSSLPTASAEYLGKMFLKSNAGADDTLHICIYRGATTDYAWKTIGLT